MTKTVLMGHFYKVYVKEGQTLGKGDRIGLMGNTGVSYGEHVHLAVADSAQSDRWWLDESIGKQVSKQSTEAFLNSGNLFVIDGKPYKNQITTEWLGYCDHYAFDLIARSAPKLPDVVWPMSKPGKVVQVKDDGNNRYGKVVLIQYDFPQPQQKPTNASPYKVVAGDTLYGIAQRHGTTVENLVRLNAIKDPNLIYPGQSLNLGEVPLRVGDVIRVKHGAKDLNTGGTFAAFVYDTKYKVLDLGKDWVSFGPAPYQYTGKVARSNVVKA